MNWSDPLPGDFSAEGVRARFRSIGEFLQNPTFENGYAIGKGTPRTYSANNVATVGATIQANVFTRFDGSVSVPSNAANVTSFSSMTRKNGDASQFSFSGGTQTCLVAGVYLVVINGVFATSTAGTVRALSLMHTGTAASEFPSNASSRLTVAVPGGSATTGLGQGLSASAIVKYGVGDTMTLEMRQDSGGALTCAAQVSYFSLVSA